MIKIPKYLVVSGILLIFAAFNQKFKGTIYLLTLNINSEYLYKNEQPTEVALFVFARYLYQNVFEMGKTIIRLTESDLHKIVRDSVYQILEQKQTVNEGWKNWAMAGTLGAASMFGNPQTANAQNYVFNSVKDPKEVTGEKIDELVLDANKPISYNYNLIKQRMSLHREKNYAKYTIWCKGRYTNKKGQVCNNVDIFNDGGFITIKGKDNEKYRTVEGQIIHTLTDLYAQSLDDKFDVSPDEFQWCNGTDYRTISVPTHTISTNYGVSGGIYRKERAPKHLVFTLAEYSPTWMKIYNKVIEETGLKDGGAMYDLDYKAGRIDGKDRTLENVIHEFPEFSGGISEKIKYLKAEAIKNYPIEAVENGIEGDVGCCFYVEKDGSITDVTVTSKDVNPLLAKVAKEICLNMPKWNPAINAYNEPVRYEGHAVVPFDLFDFNNQVNKQSFIQSDEDPSKQRFVSPTNNTPKKKRAKEDDMYYH